LACIFPTPFYFVARVERVDEDGGLAFLAVLIKPHERIGAPTQLVEAEKKFRR
jgi:hypothetical protein